MRVKEESEKAGLKLNIQNYDHVEKEMATHPSVLAWRIPGMGEPGGLPSLGSQSQTRLKRLDSSSSSTVVAYHKMDESQIMLSEIIHTIQSTYYAIQLYKL